LRKLIAMVMALLSLPAAAQDSRSGRVLAERWCMACHIVEREPSSATADGVPTFPAIAAKPGTTASSLDSYLSTGHTRMPDFQLSRGERSALVSYILSLR
jgi:mono/diheme cytochrome c family protein